MNLESAKPVFASFCQSQQFGLHTGVLAATRICPARNVVNRMNSRSAKN
jgi:hypothetical protein